MKAYRRHDWPCFIYWPTRVGKFQRILALDVTNGNVVESQMHDEHGGLMTPAEHAAALEQPPFEAFDMPLVIPQ